MCLLNYILVICMFIYFQDIYLNYSYYDKLGFESFRVYKERLDLFERDFLKRRRDKK